MGAGAFADAVVVAAGSSTRMGRDKLSELIDGRSLLEWSVAAMAAAGSVGRVIVVSRSDRVDALRGSSSLGATTVVAGGEQRSDSVRAGVAEASAEVVLVHDAARPLATPDLADRVAAAAREHGAAVPVVAVADSLKRASAGRIAGSLEREGLVRAQTPQAARRDVLLAALEATAGQSFSDEAALLEANGVAVASVPGEAANIKVTEPADLDIVRALARGPGDERLGFGEDVHAFGPEMGLWLGGTLFEEAPRLFGHSDGDVVLHALATAVLNAVGEGDLGRLFPPSDPRTAGIASAELLAAARAKVAELGFGVAWVRVSLVGARPRLGSARIEAMRQRVAELLGVVPNDVALAASTGNLTGPAGGGRVIGATALVTLRRR